MLDEIEETGKMGDELATKLREIISNFISHYADEAAESQAA